MTSALTILSQALVYALPQRWIARLLRYEAVKFLLIATAGTMATTTLFSILKWTALTDNPVTAHMLAALISAVYAYILCLAWSFADIDHASGGRWAATFSPSGSLHHSRCHSLWIARYHLELRPTCMPSLKPQAISSRAPWSVPFSRRGSSGTRGSEFARLRPRTSTPLPSRRRRLDPPA
ncbi:hypothetical protein ACETU7_03365 [Rhodococcus sp. 3Y1]